MCISCQHSLTVITQPSLHLAIHPVCSFSTLTAATNKLAMKFAIPDSDSDEEYSVVVDIDNDAGFYSDDSDDFRKVPNLTR